jgi:hypothetical protein
LAKGSRIVFHFRGRSPLKINRKYLQFAGFVFLIGFVREVMLYMGVVRTFRGIHSDEFSPVRFAIIVVVLICMAAANFYSLRAEKKISIK